MYKFSILVYTILFTISFYFLAGTTKNWIALEDSYSKNGASLASTVICNSNSPEDRNVFAIYVSYYVKVKLGLSAMGGELSLKLPFILAHSCREEEPMSPSANVHTEDITTEIPELDPILKHSNGKKHETTSLLNYETKDISSPKDDLEENLNIESLSRKDAENFDSGKIVVNIEDHTILKDHGTSSLTEKIQRKKNDSPTKKKHTEDDMNLITTYESDSTWSKEDISYVKIDKHKSVIQVDNGNKHKIGSKKETVSRLIGKGTAIGTEILSEDIEHNNFTSNIRKVVCCLNGNNRRCS